LKKKVKKKKSYFFVNCTAHNRECFHTTLGRIFLIISTIVSLAKTNHGTNARRGNKIRTLTPRKLKNQMGWIVEEQEDSDEKPNVKKKSEHEIKRQLKRNNARDFNRPHLNDTISPIEHECVADDNDDDWMEEIEKEENERISKHDSSLEHIQQLEAFQKKQRNMRRRSFTKNRRSSLHVEHKITTRFTSNNSQKLLSSNPSEEWDQFQSCMSLRSSSSQGLRTPRKMIVKNFLDTHVSEVNRMSDIYVKPMRSFPLTDNEKTEIEWNFEWKDVKKPMPLLIISSLTVGFLALVWHFYKSNKTLRFY
jgi:hypothetical protein